jgi:hypothetical protein
MRELKLTEEQNNNVLLFASGVAVAMLYELQEGGVPIEAVDFSVRHGLEEMGFKQEDEKWQSDFFEYTCSLIALERYGFEEAQDNYNDIIAEIIGLATMSVMNLKQPIAVGVIPDMDEEFTVPQEWIDEF